MKLKLILIILFLSFTLNVSNAIANKKLEGTWQMPIGKVKIKLENDSIIGIVTDSEKACNIKNGTTVVTGSLFEDNFSGNMKFCLQPIGTIECPPDNWAFVVLLISNDFQSMSGTFHIESKGCKPKGIKGNGIKLIKIKDIESSVAITKSSDEKVKISKKTKINIDNNLVAKINENSESSKPQKPVYIGPVSSNGEKLYNPLKYGSNEAIIEKIMNEGNNYLNEGYFERARKEFLKVIELDPLRAEAYNGVGVTFYARKFYDDALKWYKKSLTANPDFSDAYYNMACIYSLTNEVELSIRYLKIAILNGFIDYEIIKKDPDLSRVRSTSEFKQIVIKFNFGTSQNIK